MEDIELLLIYFLHNENADFDIKAGAEINILRFVLAHAAVIRVCENNMYLQHSHSCKSIDLISLDKFYVSLARYVYNINGKIIESVDCVLLFL